MRATTLLPFLLLFASMALAQLPDPSFPQVAQGNAVNALAASGDTLFVAGDFQQLGPYPRQHIGAVDIQTGATLPWAPAVNGRVNAILHHQGALFIGGAFTQISGQPHRLLAAYNTFTTAVGEPQVPASPLGRIYPNPARDHLHLELDQPLQTLSLMDSYGRVCRTWTDLPPGQQSLTLEDLPSGVYHLRWRSAGHSGSVPLQILR